MKTVLKVGGIVLATAATATAGWFGKKFIDKKKKSKMTETTTIIETDETKMEEK